MAFVDLQTFDSPSGVTHWVDVNVGGEYFTGFPVVTTESGVCDDSYRLIEASGDVTVTPASSNSTSASLIDGVRFAETIARAGAELILHGHMHRMSRRAIETPRGAVPVIGVASASAKAQHAHREQAQFHIYQVARKDGRWTLDLEIRALEENALAFRTQRRLSIPVPH